MGAILVRGLPGSGKTTVRDYLCRRLDATPLSTDIVRQHVPFLDVYRPGERFKSDRHTVEKSAAAYAVMLSIASEHTPEDALCRFSQWCSYVPTVHDYDELDSYVNHVMAQRKSIVICEAPFPPERLDFALSVLTPSPVLLDVIANEASITHFIHTRDSSAGESRAGNTVYRAMRKGWKTLRQQHKHHHRVLNTGSKHDLLGSADLAMDYVLKCQECNVVLR